MITETRPLTNYEAQEYGIPADERDEWLFVAVSWEQVTATTTAEPSLFDPGESISFGARTAGMTPFLQEEGLIKAMHFLLSPVNDGMDVAVSNIRSAPGGENPVFSVGLARRVFFGGNAQSDLFYDYGSSIQYRHDATPNLRKINGLERAQIKDASKNTGFAYDTRAWEQSLPPNGMPLPVLTNDINEVSLHGLRHVQLFGRQTVPGAPTLNPNYEIGVDNPNDGFGSIYVESAYKTSFDPNSTGFNRDVRPFPIEQTTPCSLFVEEGRSAAVTPSQSADFVKLNASATPLPASPRIIAVLVRWQRTSLSQQGAFWHPNRAIYSARNVEGAVEVASRITPSATPEILVTLPDLKNPAIFQMKGGKRAKMGRAVTGTFGLLARHTSGQWRLFQSKDGGKNWSFMSAPFESNNIDYMFPVATQSGVVVVAVLKGASNQLVVKRGSIEQTWPTDSAAVVVRSDVPNLPVTIVTSSDGRSDFAILFNNEWFQSFDGGNTWLQ